MTIPFRDHTEQADLGLAGFLRFVEEPGGRAIRAALFVVDATGGPVDFTFNRVEIPRPFLWPANMPQRRAICELAKSLFVACPKQPVVLLALAREVSPQIFVDDIEVQIPICRVSNDGEFVRSAAETVEEIEHQTELYWANGAPPPGSPARLLVEALQTRRLVTSGSNGALSSAAY